MTDGRVIVPPDSSGKSIDTTELLRISDQATVERQRINVADPYITTSDGIQSVTGKEAWVQDREVREQLQQILCTLQEILEELRS